MKDHDAETRIGVLIYDGVEPIDIGGTVGVMSMARRLLPGLVDLVIAPRKGPVVMAGGLVVEAPYGVGDAPGCEMLIVCGGPGWPAVAADQNVIDYLSARSVSATASVCTGAMILQAAGLLDGRMATTRRGIVGAETISPLGLLARRGNDVRAIEAALVDDAVVTGGGVSLAIDCTLYILGRIYGEVMQARIARGIEYDRALAANRSALGYARV